MENGQKPGIDERLAALAESVELLSVNVHALQDQSRKFEEQQERLDQRERVAREALLTGIAAYLRALGESNGDS